MTSFKRHSVQVKRKLLKLPSLFYLIWDQKNVLLQNQRFFKKWQCQLFQWNTISAQSGSEGQSDLDQQLDPSAECYSVLVNAKSGGWVCLSILVGAKSEIDKFFPDIKSCLKRRRGNFDSTFWCCPRTKRTPICLISNQFWHWLIINTGSS